MVFITLPVLVSIASLALAISPDTARVTARYALPRDTIPVYIVDSLGEGVGTALLYLYTAGIAQPGSPTLSDEKGFGFLTDEPDSLLISALGYRSRIFSPPYPQRADTLVLTLEGGSIRLPEVAVTERYSGIVVAGDTIRFDLRHFADGREHDVAELLTNLPGIEIDERGNVSYQGQPVDRVLLDGSDVARSFFDAYNELLGAGEVRSAEIISQRRGEGGNQERTTLNVVTDGSAKIRVDLNAGISARGEPASALRYLRTRSEGWQWYAATGANGTGESALSGADEQRYNEWTLVEARRALSLGRPSSYTSTLGTGNSRVRSRDDYAGQVSGYYADPRRSANFFARAFNTHERETSQTSLLSPFDSTLLAQFGDRTDRRVQRGGVTANLQDTSVRRLALDLFAGADYRLTLDDVRGDFRLAPRDSVLAQAAPYAFRQNHHELNPYLTARANFVISPRWSLRAILDAERTERQLTWDIASDGGTYGTPLANNPDDDFELAIGTNRRHDRATAQLSARQALPNWRLRYVAQREQRRWHERDAPQLAEGSAATLATYGQTETSDFAVVHVSHPGDRLSYGGSFGIGHVRYATEDSRATRLAPVLNAYLNRTLGNGSKWSLNGYRNTRGLDDEHYWRGDTPVDVKTLQGGLALQQPIVTRTQASTSLNFANTDNSRSGSVSVSYLTQDSALRARLVLWQDFLLVAPTWCFGQRSIETRTYTSMRSENWSLNVNGSATFERAALGAERLDYRELRLNVYSSASAKITSLLQVEAGLNAYYSRQNALAPEDPHSIGLGYQQLTLTARLRGQAWGGWLRGETFLGASVPTLGVVVAEIWFQRPGRPLSVKLRGNDLLNYRRSAFRAIQLSSANVRLFDYARLPGYVTLTLSYTWALPRAAVPQTK